MSELMSKKLKECYESDFDDTELSKKIFGTWTTYEEDIELIKQADEFISIDDNTRNCILFRMGEKEILKFLLSISEQFTLILQQDKETARKAIVTYNGESGY